MSRGEAGCKGETRTGERDGQWASSDLPVDRRRGFSAASIMTRLCCDGLNSFTRVATGRDGNGFSAGRGLLLREAGKVPIW